MKQKFIKTHQKNGKHLNFFKTYTYVCHKIIFSFKKVRWHKNCKFFLKPFFIRCCLEFNFYGCVIKVRVEDDDADEKMQFAHVKMSTCCKFMECDVCVFEKEYLLHKKKNCWVKNTLNQPIQIRWIINNFQENISNLRRYNFVRETKLIDRKTRNKRLQFQNFQTFSTSWISKKKWTISEGRNASKIQGNILDSNQSIKN